MNTTDIARADWPRAWAALPPQQVRELAATLAQRHRVDDLSLARSGLGLLPVTDGALGDTYFLGEVPLAQAHVRVTEATGRQVEGGALLLDDRVGVARSMAILDAVLSGGLTGDEQARTLLETGWQTVQQAARERKALLAATRVDFSLLGATDEEDDDA